MDDKLDKNRTEYKPLDLKKVSGGSGQECIRPVINSWICIGCGICTDYCPAGCIEINGSIAEIDYSLCIGCGNCIKGCDAQAISAQ